MNIFVGNLLFETAEADIKRLFEGFGAVSSVVIVMNKKGSRSRGFGFVEMPDGAQAQDAIGALDGRDFMGRRLNVGPACSKPESRVDSGKKARRGRFKTGRRSRSFMRRQGNMDDSNKR